MKPRDIHNSLLRTCSWILFLLATISGYMSYRGALTLAHDVIISICYAVAVAAVIYLLAMFNITIIPALSQRNRKGLAWSAYALSILIAVLISSYTNLAGIAGNAVMTLDARHHVENVQTIISQTSLSAQTAQGTVTSLKAEQSRFLELAESEKKSGTLSGSKGAGVITSVYVQAANVVDVAAQALESKKEDITVLLEQADSTLMTMREVLGKDEKIEDKALQISSLNRDLQSAYEKLTATNLGQVVENSLGALDNIIAVSKSKNSSLRKTQESVIEKIRADLKKTKERYTIENQSSETDIPEYPTWEPRFQTHLLLAYAIEIVPYIVAAISIDCGVFVLVLLLIALHREIDEDEADTILEGRKYSLSELDDTLKLLNRLKTSDREGDEL